MRLRRIIFRAGVHQGAEYLACLFYLKRHNQADIFSIKSDTGAVSFLYEATP